MEDHLVDTYGREHTVLRVSLTGACNLRCRYCRPETAQKGDVSPLGPEEFFRLIRVAVGLGIRRIRFTGGEPLLYPHLFRLAEMVRSLPGVEEITLTTNGLLLAEKAVEIKAAGIDRVNISLDSLDRVRYAAITGGGDLERVWRGIDRALRVGLVPLKINVVLMAGINEEEIPAFLALTRHLPLHIRFIELMPFTSFTGNVFLPARRVLEVAHRMGEELRPVDGPAGHGPARYYTFSGAPGKVGVIAALSENFCHRCNRLRVTADGGLRPCLYWEETVDLRPFLADEEHLKRLFRLAVRRKPLRHAMAAGRIVPTCMARIGG